uniref:Ionotropic glutamate receptor C-terminal domain-containing protein n=1 Tax=Anopheles atroparvus TaxID=41427 RepID=A0A182JLL2_ANOAO
MRTVIIRTMPGMVALSRRRCSRYRSGPLAQWLLLLGAIVGGSFALASGSIEPDERHAGVDLIWPKSRDPSLDVIRQRLIALERRFIRSNQHIADEPTIVFFQLRDATAGHADPDEDEILTMAVEAFSRRRVRGCTIFRFSSALLPAGAAEAMASIGSAGRVLLVLLLLPDLTRFSQTLLGQSARVFPLATQLVLLASSADLACPDELEQGTARSVWRNLWLTERVLTALAVWYRCSESRGMPIGRYDPFPTLPTGGQPTEGIFHVAANLDGPMWNDPRLNLNLAPLDIYGFDAAMAYRRKDIDMLPRTFAPVCNCTDSSAGAQERSWSADELFGADVEALRELATRMNFTPRLHYTRANFGFRAANGSYTGVLGRLVTTRDSWFSMNVYFLKDYETRDVQFTAAVYQDSLCVFVKAAGMLPDWLLIFRCFTPTLWIMVWSTVALVSLCYVLLSQFIAARRRDNGAKGGTGQATRSSGSRGTEAPDPVHVETVGLVGQIVGALLSAPTNGINRTSAHQKLFIAFGLIWGMTMTGAFQGSLVDVYTTPTSMKNLDTLAELDASGLPIAVNAPALIVDVFGTERPGNTIGNLKRRLVLEQNPAHPAGNVVLTGRSAALIRNQDFVRLSTKYLGSDGHARLHRLRECPRSYTLAYLYPRGSPLYLAANWHILNFLQHGLYAKWARDATHTLAMNRAFKVRQFVDRRPSQAGQVQLRLGHLLVPFMLLAGGLSLAGVIFACEHLRVTFCSRENITDSAAS